MSSLSRLLPLPLALAGAITVPVACGKDSTGPSAVSVTGIVGDNQEAPTGAQLAFPLSLIALGGNGLPLPGVSVTWTVTPLGGATFAPQSSTTDAQGTAATTVTLGGTIQDLVIQANVAGIQPVVFHATAVDPCTYVALYTIGATVNGVLTTNDCRILPGYYYDLYGFTVGAQQGVTATQTASFDTYLEIYRSAGGVLDFVGFNNNINSTNLNSQVQAIVAPGSYILAPSTLLTNVTGSYTLTSATRPQTVSGCEVLWVTRGVTISDDIAPGDCAAGVGGSTGYSDAVGINADSGSVLTLVERSAAVNARLTLNKADEVLTLVASNDDSLAGTTTNAFIQYTVLEDAVYVVFIGTSVAGQTGAYTLEISASTTLNSAAGPGARVGGTELLRFAPLRLSERWQSPWGGGRRHE